MREEAVEEARGQRHQIGRRSIHTHTPPLVGSNAIGRWGHNGGGQVATVALSGVELFTNHDRCYDIEPVVDDKGTRIPG